MNLFVDDVVFYYCKRITFTIGLYLKEDSSVCLSEVDHLYWVHLKHRFSYLVSAGQVSNITVLEPMASISEQKQ